MRKTLLILFVFFSCISFANSVSEIEARQKAESFLNGLTKNYKGATRANKNTLELVNTKYDQLYVFNSYDSEAFVIISANDKTESVLGYSDNSTISTSNISPQLLYWLDVLNNQVKAVANGMYKSRATRADNHDAIAPMVTSHWDQIAPYNLRVATSSNQYVTGCVATAMAQIMYYHKWPEAVTERVPSPGAALIDLEPTTFNWALMRDDYNRTDVDEGAQEVAKLMAYCGYAAKMDYDMGSSGAKETSAVEGLRRYLGYDKTTEVVYRVNYTSQQWDNIIYRELASQRPVMICGYAQGSGNGIVGHAFVCDGYDGKGYYHINWGWGGDSDAYFLLSVLNPDDQGVGGTPGSDGYSIWQSAIIGIQKAEKAYETRRLETTRVFTQTTDLERVSPTEDFSLKVYSFLTNNITPEQNGTFDTAFGLYNGDELLTMFDGATEKTVKSGSFAQASKTLQFGSNLSDGLYQIRALQRLSGTTEWIPAHLAQGRFLQIQITGTHLKATEVDAVAFTEKLMTGIEVVSASINGTAYAKFPVEVVASIKNTGINNTGVIELYCGKKADYSDATLVSRVGANVDIGQTENVLMHFVPEETGTYYLRISNLANDAVLKEFSVTVVSPPAIIVQCEEATVSNATFAQKKGNVDYYNLAGNELTVNLKIKNLGQETYKNYIYAFIFKRLEGESWPSSTTYSREWVSIEPGETKSVSLTFSGLEIGYQYTYSALYMDYNTRTRFDGLNIGIYLVSENTGINILDADKIQSPIYDIQGRNFGTSFDALPKGIYIIDGKKVVK